MLATAKSVPCIRDAWNDDGLMYKDSERGQENGRDARKDLNLMLKVLYYVRFASTCEPKDY